jgi:DNA-binding Lrp family transcriptional regulator
MGRPKAEIDELALIDLATRGFSTTEMAEKFEVSPPTITARIKQLQEEQGVILQWRAVRNLHLTQLQARCLEAVTDSKITNASLRDLVVAFKVLHDAELETKEQGKVSGLAAYLMQIEREEINARTGGTVTETKQIIALANKEIGSAEDNLMKALQEII